MDDFCKSKVELVGRMWF